MSVNIEKVRREKAHDRFMGVARRTALAVGVAAFLSPAVRAQSATEAVTGAAPAKTEQDKSAAPSSQPAAAPKVMVAQSTIDAVSPATQSSADASATTDLHGVIVTGQRAALKKARDRKRDADKISDSIVSDDIGKLPDNSVSEALQRVPGITINRFVQGDPDNYAVEGNGVMVRGMNEVESTLNGRDSFSVTGGRALSFEDVPPELVAGVDVYKSQSADLIEGGIGGTIDLRTHMPFDYKTRQFNLTAKYNYGDYAHQPRPEASLLYADQWFTPVGKIGALFDVAYSAIVSHFDTLQVEPYFAQHPNSSTDFSTPGGEEVYVPGGADWRTTTDERKRTGVYGALQWKPASDTEVHGTFFRSDYVSQQLNQGVYAAPGNSVLPAPGSSALYSPSGALLYASSLQTTPCSNPVQYTSYACTDQANNYDAFGFSTDTGYAWSNSSTNDFSLGLKWTPTDKLTIKSDAQLVRSHAGTTSINVFLWSFAPAMSLDLRGKLPSVSFEGAGYDSADPVQSGCSYGGPEGAGCGYGWDATMDHLEHHTGTEYAWHNDLTYDVSDSGFVRAVQAGVRLSRRTELDDVSNYNWTGLTPTYFAYYQPSTAGHPYEFQYLNDAPSSYSQLVTFHNFMKGKANLPGQAWFASTSLVKNYPANISLLHSTLGAPGDTTQAVTYQPYNDSEELERTAAAYVMMRFADKSVPFLGLPMNGNIGVRLVYAEDTAHGAVQLPDQTDVVLPGTTGTTSTGTPEGIDFAGGSQPASGGTVTINALPSLNFQFLLNPQTHLRFAAARGLNRPNFTQLEPNSQISAFSQNGLFAGFTGANGGNPNLLPETSSNYDISLEWYGERDGLAHLDVFYKNLHNHIDTGLFNQIIPITFPTNTSTNPAYQGTQNETVATISPFNEPRARVAGAEVGAQKYATFLPAPFDGLGINANFTYVHSQQPDAIAYDMNSNPIHGLPLEGLSKYSFNLIGMYDKGPWSGRLAWNWRSKYLMVTTANGTTGTATYSLTGVNYSYALPVFSDHYGQLDGSLGYTVNKHLTIVGEAANLTDSMPRSVMGVGDQQHGRSWFISDRRLAISARVSF